MNVLLEAQILQLDIEIAVVRMALVGGACVMPSHIRDLPLLLVAMVTPDALSTVLRLGANVLHEAVNDHGVSRHLD